MKTNSLLYKFSGPGSDNYELQHIMVYSVLQYIPLIHQVLKHYIEAKFILNY